MFKPIHQSFFNQSTLDLAENLLGQYIVHDLLIGQLVGKIVETEAYMGPEDRAAHSYNNRKTKRTQIMFNEPGLVYTYQMHTHTLINVVAGPVGIPHAVLIRAVQPIIGMEQMQINRGNHVKGVHLTNGPGKLTKALSITMSYYGHHWSHKPLYISEGHHSKNISYGPRVGIQNSGEATTYPWRFYVKDNPFVSKFR